MPTITVAPAASKSADTSQPPAGRVQPKTGQSDTNIDPPAADTAGSSDAKLEALARKEKAVAAQRQAMKAERDAWATEKQRQQQESTLAARLKQDWLAVLTEQGVPYDDIVAKLVGQEPPKPEEAAVNALKAKIKALEDAQAQQAKNAEEQQTQAYKQAVQQISKDVSLLVDGNPEFSLIAESNSQQAVVELIEQTFKQTGVVLSNEEAAREVENYLEAESFKVTQYKKIQEKLLKAAAPAQTPAAKPQQTQQMKTLTRQVQAPSKPLSARDRAIAAFRGEPK